MIASHHLLRSNAPPLAVELSSVRKTSNIVPTLEEHVTPDLSILPLFSSSGMFSEHESNSRPSSASETQRRKATEDSTRPAKPALRRSPCYRSERHAHYERLRALTIDPSSTFVARYKDRQTGRVTERRERIREAILPEELEDYIAWRGDTCDVEQKRKKQYLDRSRKEISKKEGQEGEEVWSLELDAAYQEAIRRVPPVLGKKKLRVPNKGGGFMLYGRNMLISRVIYKLTGQTRMRKQISSHNQVMWNFPRKLPYARYMGSLDTGEKDSRYVRIYDTTHLQWDEEQYRVIVDRRGAQIQKNALPMDTLWEDSNDHEVTEHDHTASTTPAPASRAQIIAEYSPSNGGASTSTQDSGYFSDLMTGIGLSDKLDFSNMPYCLEEPLDAFYAADTPCPVQQQDYLGIPDHRTPSIHAPRPVYSFETSTVPLLASTEDSVRSGGHSAITTPAPQDIDNPLSMAGSNAGVQQIPVTHLDNNDFEAFNQFAAEHNSSYRPSPDRLAIWGSGEPCDLPDGLFPGLGITLEQSLN